MPLKATQRMSKNYIKSMKITSQENIKNVISIFHDGGISHYEKSGNNLAFEIDIQYLAQRINKDYKKFFVILENIQSLYFEPWLDEPNDGKKTITTLSRIFVPELEILSAELESGYIRVACNQPAANLGYCGGNLYFKTSSLEVRDENERSYSFDELSLLCTEYWKEWSRKNKALSEE